MPYTDAEIAAALVAPQRTWSFRYDRVLDDGTVLGQVDVSKMSVANNDLATSVKRTCAGALAPGTQWDWNDHRLRPWARLLMLDGGWHEWPLGTFWLSSSSRHLVMRTSSIVTGSIAYMAEDQVPVEGYDAALVLNEDAVLDRYVIAAGQSYTAAVTTLITGAGLQAPLLPTNALTLPGALEWEPGTSKLRIVNDLLAAIGYRSLYVTPLGRCVSEPYASPDEVAPLWTYAVDRRSVIRPGVDVELDLFEVPNVWVAFVSEPDRPTLRSVVVNDDPSSVLSTVSRGRQIVRVVSAERPTMDSDVDEAVKNAATQAVLDAAVLRASQEASGQFEHASFSTGLMPFHGSGDVCMLDYGDGLLRFRETEWSMDLVAGGAMSHAFRRVVQL